MQYFILQHYFVTKNSLKIHDNANSVIDLNSTVILKIYLPVIKTPESLQNLLFGVLILKYEITTM